MELQMTGTNLPLSEPIREYIARKLGKLSKHLNNIIETKVEISEENTKSATQHFVVKSTVAGSGTAFHSEARGEDLFKAIDKLATVMIRQLESYKGKHYQPRQQGNTLAAAVPADTGEADETDQQSRRVVKIKRFAIKPMSIDEAIEQMEVMGHSFFLYFDADVEELKLLYRRKDGDYGMIEPELE